jgi:hypothetical protein
MKRLTTVAVGGFSSEVGKTTLLCELLRAFPGWEAIKFTRGHYRSCGKSAEVCCVSHLLADEPVIRSGRHQTYAPGKDTGRYWDAGASNVHWVIVPTSKLSAASNWRSRACKRPASLSKGTAFCNTPTLISPSWRRVRRRSGQSHGAARARKILRALPLQCCGRWRRSGAGAFC